MNTFTDLIKTNGISIISKWVEKNPNMESTTPMNNYKVTLKMGKSRLSTYFSMGMGLHGEPTVEDVLNCLASDSAGVENARSFEDWCSEYSYDTDSRKAEKTFKVCEKQAEQLKNFLGDDLYSTMLWDTESL
jgi:hypothetical protein